MNTIAFSMLQAAGGGMGGMLVMLVAMFAIMYFFMIRPQNKKQKKIQEYRNNLTTGQEVVTIGGLHGVVKSIDNDTLTLEVATGTKIKVEKWAIAPVDSMPQR
jgi:preprotein translocase subunit YajC